MAFKCIEREWCPLNNSYRHGYVLDSVADVADLPACCPGSVAVTADGSGTVFMVNASGEWAQKSGSGGNSGGSTPGSESTGGVQTDWEQSDSTQPDYLKNKPFYETTETTRKEYAPKDAYGGTSTNWNDLYRLAVPSFEWAFEYGYDDDGNSYTDFPMVEFDGQVYPLEYRGYDDDYSYKLFGNASLYNSEREDTGEPFYVEGGGESGMIYRCEMYTKLDGSHTVYVYEDKTKDTVKKIDEKFLPDDLAREGYVRETVRGAIYDYVIDEKYNLIKRDNLPSGYPWESRVSTTAFENANTASGECIDVSTSHLDLYYSTPVDIEVYDFNTDSYNSYRSTYIYKNQYNSEYRTSSYGYIGNYSLYDSTAEDTGEPFFLLQLSGCGWLFVSGSDSGGRYKVSLYWLDEQFGRMDEKFMPLLTSPNGTQYKLSVADDGTLSAVPV